MHSGTVSATGLVQLMSVFLIYTPLYQVVHSFGLKQIFDLARLVCMAPGIPPCILQPSICV